jgi:hypothetical protein
MSAVITPEDRFRRGDQDWHEYVSGVLVAEWSRSNSTLFNAYMRAVEPEYRRLRARHRARRNRSAK